MNILGFRFCLLLLNFLLHLCSWSLLSGPSLSPVTVTTFHRVGHELVEYFSNRIVFCSYKTSLEDYLKYENIFKLYAWCNQSNKYIKFLLCGFKYCLFLFFWYKQWYMRIVITAILVTDIIMKLTQETTDLCNPLARF